jgi:hypothetical protein
MTLPVPVIFRRVAVLGVAIPALQAPPHPLPLDQQVAIYSLVIRTHAARFLQRHPAIPLLLVPVLDSAEAQPGRREPAHLQGPALDTALVQALLRSGVVSGLCWPIGPQRCEGQQRGYGVRLQRIVSRDSTWAFVGIDIHMMQAERDNAYLVGSEERWLVYPLKRVNGRWALSGVAASPP